MDGIDSKRRTPDLEFNTDIPEIAPPRIVAKK
jgi:hypothetical protein